MNTDRYVDESLNEVLRTLIKYHDAHQTTCQLPAWSRPTHMQVLFFHSYLISVEFDKKVRTYIILRVLLASNHTLLLVFLNVDKDKRLKSNKEKYTQSKPRTLYVFFCCCCYFCFCFCFFFVLFCFVLFWLFFCFCFLFVCLFVFVLCFVLFCFCEFMIHLSPLLFIPSLMFCHYPFALIPYCALIGAKLNSVITLAQTDNQRDW